MSAGEGDDSTSDIEAVVEARLKAWSNPSETVHPLEKTADNGSSSKSKRLKKRRRSKDLHNSHNANATLPKTTAGLHPESANLASQRLLEQTLIRPRSRKSEGESVTPKSSLRLAAKPLIVKAKDARPNLKRAAYTRQGKHKAETRTTSKPEPNAVDALEYVEQHRREVGRFGSKALDKRDRKSFEAAELLRLGCRPPKNDKMPIAMLTGLRKRQKIRAAKKKEMDIASGMLVRSKRRG